jgi:hypothetical protein
MTNEQSDAQTRTHHAFNTRAVINDPTLYAYHYPSVIPENHDIMPPERQRYA